MIRSTAIRIGLAWLLGIGTWLTSDMVMAKSFRQSAYIANAYFSDRMVQKGETMQPMSVVKTLRTNTNGMAGYFVLDLVLTVRGEHHFKVDVLDQDGKVVTRLDYPPVKVAKEDHLPMYTAAGAITGKFTPGLWFFKVYDQLDRKKWEHLGTFGVLVALPAGE